jgi:two-component system response regulator PilR (NtrC family)
MQKESNKNRILIVDDEDSIREFLEIFFAKEGYQVHVLSNGKDALNTIDKIQFSVILSDIRMPEMDGITLLKEIKKAHPEIPVIMITAFGSMALFFYPQPFFRLAQMAAGQYFGP